VVVEMMVRGIGRLTRRYDRHAHRPNGRARTALAELQLELSVGCDCRPPGSLAATSNNAPMLLRQKRRRHVERPRNTPLPDRGQKSPIGCRHVEAKRVVVRWGRLALHPFQHTGACEATPRGPARTGCFIPRGRIANQKANLAYDKARALGDAARLRAATGRSPVYYRTVCRGRRAAREHAIRVAAHTASRHQGAYTIVDSLSPNCAFLAPIRSGHRF